MHALFFSFPVAPASGCFPPTTIYSMYGNPSRIYVSSDDGDVKNVGALDCDFLVTGGEMER